MSDSIERRRTAHLRHALSAAIDLVVPPLKAPEKIQAAVSQMLERWETRDSRPRDERTLSTIHAEIAAHWRAAGHLEGLPAATLKRASWVLFFPPRQVDAWLGSDGAFTKEFLRWMRESQRASVLNSAIRTFLQEYPTEAPTFDTWCEALGQMVSTWNDPRTLRWRERHREFSLFAPDAAHVFSGRCYDTLRESGLLDRVLERAGMIGSSLASNFLLRVTALTLGRIESRLGEATPVTESEFDRFITAALAPDGSWRFPQLRAELATALLRPFVSRDPAPAVRLKIEQFLLKHFRDPRLNIGSWASVPPRCVDVLKRWLAGKTFELFFEILARTADRQDHWEQRRAFWEPYLKLGYIHEAWVILGLEAAQHAAKVARHQHLEFGHLRRVGSTDPTHSVLLMRVAGPSGQIVVTEWSHMGKCRMWYDNNQNQPKFYSPLYSRAELIRRPSDELSHTVRWQSRLGLLIREATGV